MHWAIVAAAWAFSSCEGHFPAVFWLLIVVASPCRAQALKHAGFSSLEYRLSSCGSQAPEHRLNSRGAWAYLLHCMWDLSESGVEPVSPALAGGFFTEPAAGKPQ